MTFPTIREDIIKEFIARELLDDNICPTLDIVCAILLRDYKDVSTAKTMLTDSLLLNLSETASRAKFNKTTQYTDIDIKTLYKFVDFLSLRLEEQRSVIKQRLSLLSKVVEELNEKARGIILLNEYSDGYLEVFSESFGNLSNINQPNTTALIDTVNHYATVKPRSVSSLGRQNIKEITVNCMSSSALSAKALPGNPITQLYDGLEDTVWVYEVEVPTGYIGYTEVSLKVVLNEPTTLNKLIMKLNDGRTNDYTVKLLANIDDWTTVSDYKAYTNNVDIAFDEITVSELAICIRNAKPVQRDQSLIYTFFGQELTLSNTDSTAVSALELLPVTFKPFRQLGFNITLDTPGTSGVELYASTYSNSNVWSEFISVVSPFVMTVGSEDTFSKSIYSVDLLHNHPYNTGANIPFNYTYASEDFNYNKLALIRDIGSFGRYGALLKCYFHLDTPKTVDFSIYPGQLDGIFVNTPTEIKSGLHSFSYKESALTSGYASYLAFNGITFGSHLAKYVTPEDFMNIAEDNNYEVFTIKEKLLAKAISRLETVQLHSYIQSSTTATQVKLKCLLTGQNQNNPKIKSIHIKAA